MIQWFKKHPKYLRKESVALETDGNYKEAIQKRDNYFISQGNIIVRYKGTHKYPILIFYPNATPYVLPEVYPLSRGLTEPEMDAIASEGQTKIPADAVKQFYQYRHQNSSGLLCMLETDNLESGSKFYGITTILSRVRDWFEGHISGVFPPDSEEIELFSHFNRPDNRLRIIYSHEFLNASIVEGEFIGASVFGPSTSPRHLDNGRVFFGVYLSGYNKAGLAIDSIIPIHNFLKRDGFKTAVDLQTRKEALDKFIADGHYITGHWFDIEIEPKPFEGTQELVTLLGNGDYANGLARLAKRCLDILKPLPNEAILAVRYFNRKGIVEFQAFTLQKKANATADNLFDNDQAKIMEGLIVNYNVLAIRCEKYTEDTYFQRNGQRADRLILAKKFVNIIGAGALGSEIADIMGKAGIGNMIIIDNQLLGTANSVRHLAGMEFAGQPKAHVVATIVENHNPFLSVHPYMLSVTATDLGLQLPEDSISICSIADDNVEGFLNEQAVIGGKQVYYVRALRGGKAARIFRVIPGLDACFYCLQLYRDEKSMFVDIPPDMNFPTLRNECNNPIRPASAADLKLISSLASSIIIGQLSDADSEINHWIWSTEPLTGTAIQTPYSVASQFIPPHSHCPYCVDEHMATVHIDEKVFMDIKDQTINKSGTETGGVLAGFITSDGQYHITHASGPGPKAVEERSGFEKDIQYCQNYLDDLFVQHGEKAVYIGEWHSHPSADNRPSNIDIESLSKIALQKNYIIDKPIMIIFSSSGEPSCTVHPAGKRFYHVSLNINQPNQE